MRSGGIRIEEAIGKSDVMSMIDEIYKWRNHANNMFDSLSLLSKNGTR